MSDEEFRDVGYVEFLSIETKEEGMARCLFTWTSFKKERVDRHVHKSHTKQSHDYKHMHRI